jgi:hypothetical protein
MKKIRMVISALIVFLYIVSVVSAGVGTNEDKIKNHKEAKFYADKSHYHDHQNVKFTLKNEEKKKSIFVPCDGIISVKNKKTRQIVAEVDWGLEGDDCDSGYGSGIYELEPKHKISQTWDQIGDDGEQVDRGKYKGYTEYNDDDDRLILVNTDYFELKR